MRQHEFNPVILEEFYEAALEAYDFMICQRSDGSYYGHGGQKCHKGTESSKDEKEVSRDDVTKNLGLKGKRLATASPMLDKLNDEEFGRVTQSAAELIGVKPTPKVGMMTGEEHDMLIKNEKNLLEGFEDQTKFEKGFRKTSDAEADAFHAILPASTRNRMLPNDVVDRIKAEDPTFERKTLERDLAKRWLEQDGKDLYTGRKINLVESELEHIKPLSVAGPGPKGADQIKNFGYIDRAVNQTKSNLTMQQFMDGQVKKYSRSEQEARYEASLSRKSGKTALKAQAKEDAKNIGANAESIIKKYGPGNVKYVARELGYSNMTRVVGAGNRERGVDMFGNVKTKYSKGNRGERLENTIIRKAPTWTEADKAKARSLIAKHANVVKNGGNKQASLNNLQKELDKLGPS